MLYKALNKDGKAQFSGVEWFLPKGERPGKWMPEIKGNLVPCSRGYHVVDEENLYNWVGARIFGVEVRGDSVEKGGGVTVHRQARLIRETAWSGNAARMFLADCAQYLLHYFEAENQETRAPHDAIQAVMDYVDGKINLNELGYKSSVVARVFWVTEDVQSSIACCSAWYASRRDLNPITCFKLAQCGLWGGSIGDDREWVNNRFIQYVKGDVSDMDEEMRYGWL